MSNEVSGALAVEAIWYNNQKSNTNTPDPTNLALDNGAQVFVLGKDGEPQRAAHVAVARRQRVENLAGRHGKRGVEVKCAGLSSTLQDRPCVCRQRAHLKKAWPIVPRRALETLDDVGSGES